MSLKSLHTFYCNLITSYLLISACDPTVLYVSTYVSTELAIFPEKQRKTVPMYSTIDLQQRTAM